MGKVIGIDLGTTNSCVAVVVGTTAAGELDVKVIPNAEGARTTPSVVAFSAKGERLVGQVAKRQATTNPENTIHAVKRLMGRKFTDADVTHQAGIVAYQVMAHENGDAWVKLNGKPMSPPEVSSVVLASLKQVAERYLGEPITEAIITVPAYFDDAQRQATKDAGAVAGLDVKRIINEPTAAAVAYGLDKSKAEKVAVYDLGGGTFDISILEISGGVFNVKGTGGDTHLGGEDFDNRVIEKLLEEFKAANNFDLSADRMALQRLREAAEKAKHELSSSLETEINIPFIASGPTGPLHLERTLKRNELETLTRDLVERTLVACRQVLKDVGFAPKDVDQVVLVGGMTRMPAVQKAVKELFQREPSKEVDPDEVVAVGAAIQGAALSGVIDEVLLLDVTPLSIGVETGGGVFTRLIPRNTTVPTEQSEIFTTSVDNQHFVPIHVLQGEREMAVDNRSLAQFELTGIPPAPRGVPKIEVKFQVDANGILSVKATDLGTQKSQEIKVRPTSGLSEAEVEQLVSEGDKFKETDQLRRDLAEIKNQSETLIYTTEQALDAYSDLLGDKCEPVRKDMERLRQMLDSGADLTLVREAYARLENATFELAEAMYGEPGA
ncbi:MAG: molecular chaperone DnaK [Polyangiaceae bacterium]|nr:molecular chaperone DnaK [Polyangiaceae bacterium]